MPVMAAHVLVSLLISSRPVLLLLGLLSVIRVSPLQRITAELVRRPASFCSLKSLDPRFLHSRCTASPRISHGRHKTFRKPGCFCSDGTSWDHQRSSDPGSGFLKRAPSRLTLRRLAFVAASRASHPFYGLDAARSQDRVEADLRALKSHLHDEEQVVVAF